VWCATESRLHFSNTQTCRNLRALGLQTWGLTTQTASPRRAAIPISCPLAIPHQVGGQQVLLTNFTSPRFAANPARLLLIGATLSGAAPTSPFSLADVFPPPVDNPDMPEPPVPGRGPYMGAVAGSMR
jgi:hypothetical protein